MRAGHALRLRCAARGVTRARAQIFSSDAVQSSGGVYWMFYEGACFEEAPAPAGLPGLEAGAPAEGLRCAAADCWRLVRLRSQPSCTRHLLRRCTSPTTGMQRLCLRGRDS